jgi:FkbM family methyltransferase
MIWTGCDTEFKVREDTTDWNTVNAAVGEDEYGLKDVDMLNKLVVDVGSHIGSIGIWCAVRGAFSVCIEPLSENVQMIYDNAEHNGVLEQIDVYTAAAGVSGEPILVQYGYESNETERAHAFIGNIGGHADHQPGKVARVYGMSLYEIISIHGVPDIVKLDCEGGEWAWLKEPEIGNIPLIVGEWHPTDGHQLTDVVLALEGSHDLEFTGPHAGPGGFRATRR